MLDALGHPITEGCTVLTSSYRSPVVDTITKVVKVTNTRVHVYVDVYNYDYCEGKYLYKKTPTLIKRRPHQIIVIDKQLAYNQKSFPENML